MQLATASSNAIFAWIPSLSAGGPGCSGRPSCNATEDIEKLSSPHSPTLRRDIAPGSPERRKGSKGFGARPLGGGRRSVVGQRENASETRLRQLCPQHQSNSAKTDGAAYGAKADLHAAKITSFRSPRRRGRARLLALQDRVLARFLRSITSEPCMTAWSRLVRQRPNREMWQFSHSCATMRR